LDNEPYMISIDDSMGVTGFFHQLYDSLNAHIGKISSHTLHDFEVPEGHYPDSALGWLQSEFDNTKTGSTARIEFVNEDDKIIHEFYLKNSDSSSNDKVEFTHDFRVDSIPKVLLDARLWKKAIDKKNLWENVRVEKEKFRDRRGVITREFSTSKEAEIKDTLYGYPYRLNVDIVMDYYSKGSWKRIRSKFSIPSETMVYHQPKF